MMRVQARAQALASLLYSLSASPGFLRVHPLRIHPLSVPWPPRVQVQPSSISYMDNLLRSLQTHFLAPTCNTSRFACYRHRIQLFFRFCHIHLQAHISTTWIGSHLGVPAKCCPGDVPKVGSTNANLNRDIQGIHGTLRRAERELPFSLVDLIQANDIHWISWDFSERTRWFCWPQLKVEQR